MNWVDKPQNYMGLYGILPLVWAIVLCKCLFLTALPQCSIDGIRSLAGCHCKFVKACDVHKTHRPAFKISYYLPKGLQLYSFRRSASTNRNLTHLCKGQRVAILFDCNSCMQLYAATVVTGSQLVDRRVLRERLIQNAARYPNIFSNETWIKQRGENKRLVWRTWPATNLIIIEKV